MATYTADTETIVNTGTTSTQGYPTVTTLTDGGWVVTWMGYQSGYYDVYQQRYDSDGQAVDGEVVVNTYVTTSQGFPSVAAMADGGWIVTWYGNHSTESGYGVFLQRFDANGATVDGEVHVNTTTSSNQEYPVVTVLADGGWVVAWDGPGTGDTEGVFLRRYDANGDPVGGETLVNTTTTNAQNKPAITTLSDGGWVVAWHGNGTGDSSGVFQKRYDASGNLVAGETLVNSTTTGTQSEASITALADGGWVVSWFGQGTGDTVGVYQQQFDEDGIAVGGETLVNTWATNGQNYSSITALSDGGWVVVWASSGQDGSSDGIYAQVYDSDGTTSGTEFRINSTTSGAQSYPSVTALDDGNFLVTWQSANQDGSGSAVIQSVVYLLATADVSLSEDGFHAFAASEFDFSVADGTTLVSITVTELPANGTLTLDGVDVTVNQVIAYADLGDLVWTPEADDNGDGLATFKFKSLDSVGDTARSVVNFNVTAVADIPTSADDTVTINEDASHTFSASDFAVTDVDSDTLASITITELPESGSLTLNGNAVAANDVIVLADLPNLVWTPDADDNGTALDTLKFKITDTGGSTSTSAYTITFDVTAVADAPTGTDDTITVDEDGSHTFSAADFGFSDVEGDTLASITITSPTSNGTLELDGVTVTANQTILAADIGKLVWTPAANANGSGYDSLNFTVTDSTSTVSTSSKTLTFDVTAVQDAPTATDGNFRVNAGGSHTFSAEDFGFSDTTDGDSLASITITTLPASGTLQLNGTDVTANQVITAADIPNLVWTAGSDDIGYDAATLSFVVTDDQGTSSSTADITFDVGLEYAAGDETIVNTYTTGNQADPKIAKLSDGGWVVVWWGPSANGVDVYQQRYDADGAALGSETIVNTYTSDNQGYPAITALSDGGWLVSWFSTPHGSTSYDSAYDIHQNRFDADGDLVGSETQVNSYTTGTQQFESVTGLADGGWVVTWTGQGAGDTDGLFMQRYDAAGATVGSQTLVNTTTVGSQKTDYGQASVAALGDGGWVVTWYGQGATDTAGVHQQRYDADGDPVGTETLVNATTTGDQITPAITALEDGGWIVTWSGTGVGDTAGIYMQRYDADGDPVGSETLVNTYTTNSQTLPTTTALSDGGWVVVWVSSGQDGSSNGIFAQAYDSDGNAVGGEVQINTTTASDQTQPSVIGLDEGGFVVTWKSSGQDGGNNAVIQTVVPLVAPKDVAINEDTAYTFTSDDFAYSVDGGASLVSITIKALPDNGTLTLDGATVTVNQTIAAADLADLVWTLDANENGDGLGALKFTTLDSSSATTRGTLTFNVTAIADAPTSADDSVTINEDASYTFSAADFAITDGDGDTLASVTITGLPDTGALQLNGVTVSVNDEIAAADLGNLVWMPDSDDHGTALDTLTFKIKDSAGTTSASSYTITFNVTSVADAPTASDDTITIDEDGSHTFSAADFGFADGDNDGLASVTITTLPAAGTLELNGVTVTANQVIAADDIPSLVWTPDADANGSTYATLGFKVTDTASTTSATENVLTFDVTAVNDIPTSSGVAKTISEDSSYTFSASDFAFSDAEDGSATSIVITQLPSTGSLTLDGEAVSANDVIALADIATLVWTPDADDNGTALGALQFKVKDADGATSANAYTFSINVTAAPDVPTTADKTITIDEDGSHTFTADDFGFADVDGDTMALIQIKSLPATGSLTLNGTSVSINTVVNYADIGNLVWTPGADDNGTGIASFNFKTKDSAGSVSTVENTITFDVTAVNDAPTSADDTVTIDEDTSYTFSASDFAISDIEGDTMSSVTITALPGSGSLTLDGVAVTANQVIDASDLGSLVWTPAANAEGDDLATLSFKVTDSQGASSVSAYTITLDVDAINDAPTSENETVTIDEDASYTFSADDFAISDIEGETLASVTITTLPASGSLTLDGVAVTANQVIDANDLGSLVWTPAANAEGDDLASLSFKITDAGGATSASAYTITFDVDAVNDAPTSDNDTVTIDEDTSYTFSADDFAISDIEGDTLSSVTITALPASGSLTLDGVAVTANQVIDANDLGSLVWTPAANAEGDALASLSFKVTDAGGATSVSAYTITLDVDAINDAPTSDNDTVTIDEDTSYTFSAGDFAISDIEGDTLASVTITALPASGSLTLYGVAVTANQVIDANDLGSLVWTPAANAEGDALASLSFKVTDAGGATSASAYTITFDVDAVNDAPTSDNDTVTIDEDTSYTFSASDFAISDMEGDTLSSVTITALPASGSLTLDGVAVTANQVIDADDLGSLVWTPAANAEGDALASLSFKVTDSGGATSVSAYTITFDVTPVDETNTAPTAENGTIDIVEDGSHVFGIDDFGFADSDGDTLASVTITALPASGSLTLDGVAVTANQVIDADDLGSLVWTPAANAEGDDLASLSFKVTDSEGATSASAYTITFDVDAVNDAPTSADETVTLVEDTSYTFSVDDFAISDIEGDGLAAIVITGLPETGSLTLDGVAVSANQEIAASELGNLVWTPDADANGAGLDGLTFKVRDSGGAVSTAAYTITFDVIPDEDGKTAPTAADVTIDVTEDGSHVFSAADFGFADADGDTLASVTITTLPAAGLLTLNGVAVSANDVVAAGDLGDLVWTPAANAEGDGLATLGFKVTDSSGETSSAYAVTFDVTPVNDAPTSANATVTVDEDTAYTFSAADFAISDVEGDTLASVLITSLPENGSLTLDGVAVTANQEIAVGDLDGLVWTPAANAEGDDLAALSFKVTDADGATSASAYTITFDVAGVNDAPTSDNDTVTIDEDTSYTFSADDFAISDIDGDTLSSVTITALPASGSLTLDGVAVTANQIIDADDLGSLVWTPAANAEGDGLASLSFKVTDSEGATSASAYTITFDVDAVNDAPTSADETVTLVEDTSYTFSVDDFAISDIEGDGLAAIVITGLPETGSLTLDGVAVSANQEIAASELGNLVWTPDADANGAGLDGLTFKVRDSGGAVSTAAYTITFDVIPDEDGKTAPTAADVTIDVTEDGSHVFSAADFGFADADGDTLASVTITTLPAAGLLTLNGVAVSANDVVAAGDLGDLVWTPAANAEGDGLATLGFKVTDSSGETSSAYAVTFDVTPVNDAPTSANATVTVDEDTAYTFSAADFAISDVEGDTLASVLITSLPENGSLTLDGVAVTANQEIAVGDLDGLVWTPAANAEGDDLAALSFKVTDADGATSASAYTITFDVAGVNDAPTSENDTVTIDEDGSYTFSASDFAISDIEGDTLAAVVITGLPETGTLTLDGVAVVANQEIAAGDLDGLVWTPATDASGQSLDSLTFKVKDSGGAVSSAAYVITFDVTEQVDPSAPVAEDFSIRLAEDGSYAFDADDFHFLDADGDAFASITVTGVPASGSLTFEGEDVIAGQVIAAADLGDLVWTPDADAKGEDLAAMRFSVTDETGATSDVDYEVSFDVDAVNDGPVAVNDTARMKEGGKAVVNVVANDTDIDGDALQVASAKVTSSNGKVVIDDAGRLVVTYTGKDLDPGKNETITVRYETSDGEESSTGILTVKVKGQTEPGDTLFGTQNSDKMTGSNVGERIIARDGADVVKGRGGDDVISAQNGHDRVFGGDGDDTIGGGSGMDVLRGGAGDDRISGWDGDDRLTGGEGADTFIFRRGDGRDVITDFQTAGAQHDKIDLSIFDNNLSFADVQKMMTDKSAGVVINVSSNLEITLVGIDSDDLTREHFIL
jgi:hypothetical protein